ncbi:MAG: PEP-CTERM sorting domain-containing protein [Pirellulales bacterium]|nr:PEP-CTERM sorting domain-containing protein [Pirellulales bacterium]
MSLRLYDSDKSNDGTLEATNGGTLQIYGIDIDNTGCVILADGGIVSTDYAAIIGGTLTSTGTSYFSGNGPTTLSGVTLSTNSQYYILGGKTTTVTNGLTNHGTITVNSNNAEADTKLLFGTSQTLAGTGCVVLCDVNNDSNRAQLNAGSGAMVTQAADHTIRGHGEINAPLDNLGTVEADDGVLYLRNTVTQLSGATLTGGTWIARPDSTLVMTTGGNVTKNQGTVILDGAGSIFTKIDSLADNQGGFSVLGGRSFTTAGDLVNSGSLTVDGGGTFTVSGDLSGTGDTVVSDGSVLIATGITQNSLTIGGSGAAGSAGNVTPVPEPGTLPLLALAALGGFFGYRRRPRL